MTQILKSISEANNFLKRNELADKRIVLTNGCFDLLHLGHVTYLQQARSLGDFLMVGLNSDSSVKMLKGADRPINHENDRAAVLAALTCVDAVVIFEEKTSERLATEIDHDIYVKGGDYTVDELPGVQKLKAKGVTIRIIPFLDGYSTSALLEKIKKS